MKALPVTVVCGGRSGEAAVSRVSAGAVARALEQAGHRVETLELDAELASRLLASRPEVVFPVAHGRLGEDGSVQGLLELLELPYVGSGVLASALAFDKPLCKQLWRQCGIPVARDLVIRADQPGLYAAARARTLLGPAIAVKPGAGGSALGVSLISSNQTDRDLADAIGRALALDPQVLLEPLLEGQEVTCAVLEDETGCPRALAPTLILPQRGAFYDFVSKYAAGGSRHLCPAPLPEPLLDRIKEVAVRAHQALGCRDLSRVDCFVDERRAPEDAVTVLEINTMPGMTSTSLFPEAAAASGMEFAKLCDHLVGLAHRRPGAPRPEAEPMPD